MADTPRTISKIIPLELALIDYVDGKFEQQRALIAIDRDLVNYDPNSVEYKTAVRIIDFADKRGWKTSYNAESWVVREVKRMIESQANVQEGEVVTEQAA